MKCWQHLSLRLEKISWLGSHERKGDTNAFAFFLWVLYLKNGG